jgi:hypothetical protein
MASSRNVQIAVEELMRLRGIPAGRAASRYKIDILSLVVATRFIVPGAKVKQVAVAFARFSESEGLLKDAKQGNFETLEKLCR